MKKYVNKDVLLILKGFIIGSSMSVPGVSGGTMAILLGIYDQMIHSISDFFNDIPKHFLFLVRVTFGSLLGIATLAFVIKWLLDTFPIILSFLFVGAVIGGVGPLVKKTKETSIRISSVIYVLIGFSAVLLIGMIPHGFFSMTHGSGISYYLMVLATGIIIAIALVLPGISTSHMLLVMGMYETLLVAITTMDILYIAILGTSTLLGVFLITKPLEWIMNQYTKQTYLVIIGFVIGSTSSIIKELVIPFVSGNADAQWWIIQIVISAGAFCLGYRAITFVSELSEKSESGAQDNRSIPTVVKVIVDRPIGSVHPAHKDLAYPINYGYIEGIMARDGEEQDAYILGIDQPLSEFTGVVIAIAHRINDVEDKWIVAERGKIFSKEEIMEQISFQEKYFQTEITLVDIDGGNE